MVAGGFKTFVAGEILDEDKINDFLMQGVLVFADAAARDAAITSPVHGQVAFLKDTNETVFYDGTSWETLATDVSFLTVDDVAETTGSPTINNYTDGGIDYRSYTFTGSGSIVFSSEGLADVLAIGGGSAGQGSNNFRCGGGGGAGGYFEQLNVFFAEGTATVVVGAGGSGTTDEFVNHAGTPSKVGLFEAIGGGNPTFSQGGSGGSGGGGSASQQFALAGGNSVGNQGNSGGSGIRDAGGGRAAGGGGGAGASGVNASGNTGGSGGSGAASDITGSSVTRAGGGGGGGGSVGGSGGAGGGGAGGGFNTNGSSATVNTGSGGGGSDSTSGSNPRSGGNGGSGIVVVRVRR